MRSYEIRFRRGGRELTWTRYALNDVAARASAERALAREYPDGDARIVSVHSTF